MSTNKNLVKRKITYMHSRALYKYFKILLNAILALTNA